MQRNLADHVVALSEAIDTVKEVTGRDVHLAGYSQGGMFAYQTAAYRRSKDLASIIAFGSPVDTLAALPMNLPAGLGCRGRRLHGRPRLQPHRHPGLAGAHRIPDARPDQDRPVAAGLPAPAARPRGAAAPRTAAPVPRVGGLDRLVRARDLRTAQAVHRPQPDDDRRLRASTATWSPSPTSTAPCWPSSARSTTSASRRRCAASSAPRRRPMSTNSSSAQGISVWSSGRRRPTQTWPTVAQLGQVDRRRRRHARRRRADGAAARRAHRERRFARRRGWRTAPPPRPRWRSAWRARRPTRSSRPTSRRGRWPSRPPARCRRLARLGQINDHTRISLGRIMSEQARERPDGEFLLFDGRVHTYEAVDRRINNVVRGLIEVGVRQGAHVGVLMETRPSALVAIAALSRLGAVAVLMPPDGDLATAARLGAVSEIIADPSNLEAARELPTAGAGARRRRIARPAPAGRRRRHRHGADRPRRRRPARLVPAEPRARP